MINWMDVKNATDFTGGEIRFNPWSGNMHLHPRDSDVELLADMPDNERVAAIKALIDKDIPRYLDTTAGLKAGARSGGVAALAALNPGAAASYAASNAIKGKWNDSPKFKAYRENFRLNMIRSRKKVLDTRRHLTKQLLSCLLREQLNSKGLNDPSKP